MDSSRKRMSAGEVFSLNFTSVMRLAMMLSRYGPQGRHSQSAVIVSSVKGRMNFFIAAAWSGDAAKAPNALLSRNRPCNTCV